MSGIAKSCERLENPLRGRPRPRRNHKPTRTREVKNAVLHDSVLDLFFPTVSADDSGFPDLTLLGADDVNVSIPQHRVAAAATATTATTATATAATATGIPSLTHHLPEEDPYPCRGQAGGGSPDVGGGYRTEEEEDEGCLGRRTAGEHILDGRRRKITKKAGDEGVKKQIQEEGDSGIITMKGRSVPSLAAFLGKRVHMYMAGPPEGSCPKREALYSTSEDDDAVHDDDEDDDILPGDSDSPTDDFTEDFDFLTEIVSFAGDDYRNQCYMSKVYSSEVDYPAQVGFHKSGSYEVNSPVQNDSLDGGHSTLTDDHGTGNDPSPASGHPKSFDFSLGTSGLPRVKFLSEEPGAKGDSPSAGSSPPASRGATEETLTPRDLLVEKTEAFEKISEESPEDSKSPITEDSGLTPIRTLTAATMTPRTPSTAETGNPFTYGPVTEAKGKRGRGTPPPKPPRTFLSGGSHVRAQEKPREPQNEDTTKRSLECGTGDEREVTAGTSPHGGESQASTLGCEKSSVEKNDNNDLGAEGRYEPIVPLSPHSAGVGSSSRAEDGVNAPHNRHGQIMVDVNISSKLSRKGCIRKTIGTPFLRNPGVGTIPMHPEGTIPERKEPLMGRSSRAMEEEQEACPEHGAALKFYCAKCREVICQECREVAHHQPEYHQVLNTCDALGTLRAEAVKLLRHYTLLSSLHGTLADTYHKFVQSAPQNGEYETISLCLRLEDGKVLGDIAQEAEAVVLSASKLTTIRESVRKWERRQYDWGDIVFLAHRCSLLANVTTATDKVYLRAGDWVMPTPWIQLSHMLQPYLKEAPSPPKDTPQATPTIIRSPSPTGMRTCSGAKDQCFPDNARQVLLFNLIPYIIFNPDIRYFIHVTNYRDVDLTMIVVPDEDHWKEYLKIRLRFAVMSPGALRQNGFTPSEYSLLMVEKLLMMGGRHYTQLTASHMAMGSPGTPATSTMVKVSFQDVTVATGRLGLVPAVGGIKQGDLVIDQDSNGRSILAVAVRDVGDAPALRLGRVVLGLDGFTYLMEAGNMRRNESSGFRNKILSTVRREEAAVYQVTFGMDL